MDLNKILTDLFTTIKKCLNDKEIPATLGNQVRDFIFIDDLIEIILKFSKKLSQKEFLILDH